MFFLFNKSNNYFFKDYHGPNKDGVLSVDAVLEGIKDSHSFDIK